LSSGESGSKSVSAGIGLLLVGAEVAGTEIVVVDSGKRIVMSLAIVAGVGLPIPVNVPVCVSSAGGLELIVVAGVGIVPVVTRSVTAGASAPVDVTAEPGALRLDRKHCCGKVCVM